MQRFAVSFCRYPYKCSTMKYFLKFFCLIMMAVVLLQSCTKEDNFPDTKTITRGEKWGLRIGSSALDVYTRLQQLGSEKGFGAVSIVGQHYFSAPEELQDRLSFYQAITLQSPEAVINRVVISFSKDVINSIEAGGGMLNEIDQWPQGVSNETVIHKGDKIATLYDKLVGLYQISTYVNYQIILPEKTLSKDFDPAMINYNEWGFSFEDDVKPGKRGRTSVGLFFKNGKLEKISYSYDESNVYN